MGAKRYLTPDVVVRMYTEQHLTMQQIATLHSVSKAAVNKVLKRAGIERTQGTFIDCNCGYCGAPLKMERGESHYQARKFCNPECYHASFQNPGYRQWRPGSRIARALVAQWFMLEPEHIVHHVDGNDRNSDRANLEVYASQADHMAMHRGRKVEPLWRGKS